MNSAPVLKTLRLAYKLVELKTEFRTTFKDRFHRLIGKGTTFLKSNHTPKMNINQIYADLLKNEITITSKTKNDIREMKISDFAITGVSHSTFKKIRKIIALHSHAIQMWPKATHDKMKRFLDDKIRDVRSKRNEFVAKFESLIKFLDFAILIRKIFHKKEKSFDYKTFTSKFDEYYKLLSKPSPIAKETIFRDPLISKQFNKLMSVLYSS